MHSTQPCSIPGCNPHAALGSPGSLSYLFKSILDDVVTLGHHDQGQKHTTGQKSHQSGSPPMGDHSQQVPDA